MNDGVVTEYVHPDDEITTKYYLCESCNGEGQTFDYRDCPACEGTGEYGLKPLQLEMAQ